MSPDPIAEAVAAELRRHADYYEQVVKDRGNSQAVQGGNVAFALVVRSLRGRADELDPTDSEADESAAVVTWPDSVRWSGSAPSATEAGDAERIVLRFDEEESLEQDELRTEVESLRVQNGKLHVAVEAEYQHGYADGAAEAAAEAESLRAALAHTRSDRDEARAALARVRELCKAAAAFGSYIAAGDVLRSCCLEGHHSGGTEAG